MNDPLAIPGLTGAGCQARQQSLRPHLERLNLDAALICDRRHVHYLTGYWCRAGFAAAVLLERDGPTVFVTPLPAQGETASDVALVYASNRLGTLVDDHAAGVLEPIRDRLMRLRRIGCDGPVCPWLLGPSELVDMQDVLFALRRRKSEDEIALLRRTIAATEAAYQYARETLKAGVTEVALFAGMQAAAADHVGETIGEFGNDFQIGAAGSAPRRRPAQTGEVAIFDLSVVVRGYHSDMCRSFVVGGSPSQEQLDAHHRIMQVLDRVEKSVRPGVRCRAVYEEALSLLAGYRGWSFPHHLGHGIGLNGHEAPRLNPHWDDTFQVGDVFTAEPGLYGPSLKAGVRIEQVYHLAEKGLERLTTFSTALA
jgi:Xaa-Pro aminopeptidase